VTVPRCDCFGGGGGGGDEIVVIVVVIVNQIGPGHGRSFQRFFGAFVHILP
jgi:hypothetical protein